MDSNEKYSQQSNDSLNGLVKVYCEATVAGMKGQELDEKSRPEWNHMNHLLDVLRLDALMTKDFDFKHYYCEYGKYEMKELAEMTKKQLGKL